MRVRVPLGTHCDGARIMTDPLTRIWPYGCAFLKLGVMSLFMRRKAGAVRAITDGSIWDAIR
jgi:hypothetical protein